MKQQHLRSIYQLPKRPQKSQQVNKIGKKISLISNHFQISLPKTLDQFFLYSISIWDSKGNKLPDDARSLIKGCLRVLKPSLNKLLSSYNLQGLNIWSITEYKDMMSFDCSLNECQYLVQLKQVSQAKIKDLLNGDSNSNQLKQIQNAKIENYMINMGFANVGKNSKYYRPADRDKNPVLVGKTGLQILQGFRVTSSLCNGLLMLQVDFSSRVLRNETALQRIRSFKDQQMARENMKDISVLATYANFKLFKIVDINFNQNPTFKFTLGDKSEMTLIDYYREKYKINIQDITQPLLVYKPYRKSEYLYLIPELVHMTGLTDMEKSNGKLMCEVAKSTKLDPSQRQKRTLDMARQLRNEYKKENYDLNPVADLEGIQLREPGIKMSKIANFDKMGNILVKDPILKPAYLQLESWILAYHSFDDRQERDIDYFVWELQASAKRLGMTIQEPRYLPISSHKTQDWLEVINHSVMHDNPKIEFVLTFSGGKQSLLYNQLKDLLIRKIGIPHQHVLAEKFLTNKNPGSFTQKLALQINAKLGLPILQVEQVKGISDKTMLIGIDVWHKTLKNRKSCAAFVATLDPNFSKMHHKIIIQKQGVELMKEVGKVLFEALNVYKSENNFYPDTIILYRDGVGESQVSDLIEVELKEIHACFARIEPNYKPQFAEILVNKRISDRLFIQKGASREDCANAPGGTLVSDKIVKDNFNFFLIAQNVGQGQGTATPTHYTVIENSTTLSEDMFWQLTYFQCFNYANWLGPVRVPGVCQYAHKKAYACGETFQSDSHPNLSKKLVFL